ncbi:MAG: hypothetical protein ABH865_06575 [Candidatus Omnitrophota bacterium]|nr:hypothetical protein [Candidatus Omnitrophota bacterium]
MKKILIAAIVGLTFFLALSSLLGSMLPSRIRTESTAALAHYFNKDVTIGEVSFSLIKGISYSDITLLDKGTQTVYARLRGVTIVPFYPSFVGAKRIIFRITIDQAYARLTREPGGVFDISAAASKGTLLESYIINTVTVKKLTLDVQDKVTNVSHRFSDIRLSVHLVTPPHARFDIAWGTKAHFRGKYNLREGNIKATLLMRDVGMTKLAPYITSFKLSGARVKEANVTIVGKQTYMVSGEGHLVDITLLYPLTDITSNAEQIVQARGDIRITGGAVATDGSTILYRINGALEKMDVDGLPLVGGLHDMRANFILDTNSLDVRGMKTLIKGIPIEAHVNLKDFKAPKIYIEGAAEAPLEAVATFAGQIAQIELPGPISGTSRIEFVLRGNTLEKTVDYLLEYQLTDATIGEHHKINAHGRIQRDTLFLDQAKLSYRDVPLSLKGSLENLSALGKNTNAEVPAILTLKGNIQTSLAQLARATTGLDNFSFAYTGPGNVALAFTLRGDPLRKEFKYSGTYTVDGARMGSLEHIAARGKLGNDSLTIKEGNLSWRNIPFIMRGTIEHFAEPRLSAALEGNGFSIIGKGHRQADTFEIDRAVIKGKNTDITAYGTLGFAAGETSIKGKGGLGIEEALEAARKIGFSHAILKPGSLSGTLEVTFMAKGTGSPGQWRITAQGHAQEINIYRARLHQARLVLLRDPEALTISPFTGSLAGGIVELRAKLDFPQQKLTANILANDIDLAALRDELSLRAKNLSGKLSLDASIENNNVNRVDSITGQGKITVKEGNIWEINFLKGMGEFLFIPDFDEIKFKEGCSDFSLKNNGITFENMELKSFQMNMEGGGRISSGGAIHFMLFPRFNQGLVSASEGLKKITTNFLGKSGLLIEIQGTLKEPQYKVQPLLLSPMQRIKKFFKELQN